MINTQRNFYEILNASPSATFEELKSNYKHLILQCHPDKLQQQQQHQQLHERHESVNCKLENDLNNKEFVAIAEAWNCLKDPLKRKQYDAELLLNKFHTHNNIYAHIQLREMKKCLSTADELELDEEKGGMESDSGNAAESSSLSTSYIYTYDCRCGGQYIVDESAEQYCRKVNSTGIAAASAANGSVGGGDDDDADITQNNNKNSPNKTVAHNNNDDGGGSEGVGFNEDEEDDGELIVECSECSLVIILNG